MMLIEYFGFSSNFGVSVQVVIFSKPMKANTKL